MIATTLNYLVKRRNAWLLRQQGRIDEALVKEQACDASRFAGGPIEDLADELDASSTHVNDWTPVIMAAST